MKNNLKIAKVLSLPSPSDIVYILWSCSLTLSLGYQLSQNLLLFKRILWVKDFISKYLEITERKIEKPA